MAANKQVLWASAALALLPFTGTAAAQDVPPVAEENTDEIVVTARRREEQLRDVPASVTAITEEQRQALVLDRVDDYLRQVQGATLVTSGPEYLNDITIRGQGSGRIGFTETATGLYRDGLYNSGGGFGGRTLSRMDLFDTDRVEVLRGPQGALFGRNAVGGAINIIPNAPEDELGARILGRYGDPDRTDVEAILNIPIDETFALRLGGFLTDQDEGFIYNTTTGRFIDAQRVGGARVSAEARPNATTSLSASWEYFDSETPAFTGLARNPTLDPDPYVRANQNREGVTDVTENALTLSGEFDLGWADLSLRAARRERDGQRTNEDNDHFGGVSLIDVDPTAAVTLPDYSQAQFETYSRDILQAVLTSKPSSSWSWLVGAEFLQSTDDVVTEPINCPAYTGAALPGTPGCFVGFAGTLTGTSLTARTAGRRTMNHDTFIEDLESISIFGAVEFELTADLTFGAELRVQRDDRQFSFERWSEDPLVFFGSGAVPAGLLAPLGGSGVNNTEFCPPTLLAPACAVGNETAAFQSSQSRTFYTPTATLRWAASADQNFYLRFATGYRSGGFNTNLPPALTRAQLQPAVLYEPEYAYNYEAGWKGDLFGFSAEAAVYYTWTNEVQVVTAPIAGSTGFVLSNAGDAHVYGFEAELRRAFDVGPGRFVSRLAFTTQAGEFEEGASLTNQSTVIDLEGLEVPRLRDYQVTLNLLYSQPLGTLRGFAGVSGQWADGGFDNPDNTREYQGYELYDARLGLEGEHWRFSVFGRNLSNDQYLLNIVSANEFWSQPRSYGAEFTLRY